MTAVDTSITPRVRSRARVWIWCAVTILVLVAIAVLTIGNPPTGSGYLDPGSGEKRGGHALAELLRGEDVQVIGTRRLDDVRAQARPGDQIMVVDNGLLTAADVKSLAAMPTDLLLLEPTAATRAAIVPDLLAAGSISDSLTAPNCSLREAVRAGTVRLDRATTYEADGAVRCYDGALVRMTRNGRTINVLGSADPLTNARLPHDGSAALSMNLAGRSNRLIWFRPAPPDSGSGDAKSIEDLYPPGVGAALWQCVIAVVLLALWRGRRLGRVVAERLPVVVRASETTEGRARLYRAHRARDSAAGALREAALHRITRRLGLSADAPPGTVAALVAERTGRPAADVGPLLYGDAPPDDGTLIELTRQLDILERQVLQQ